MRRRRTLLLALSLASSAAFLALALRRLEPAKITEAFAASNVLPWVPLAVVCYLVGHLLRGIRCQLLVRAEAELPLTTATNVVVVGYAVNNVLPARVGELARAGMLSTVTGLPFLQCLTVTLVERILDGLALLVLLVVASTALPAVAWVDATIRFAALVFGAASSVVVLALLAPTFLLTTAGRLLQPLGGRLHGRLLGLVSHVIDGMTLLKNARAPVTIVAVSLAIWLIEASMFLLLFPAFHIEPDPYLAVVAMSVTNFGILVPSSPGFIGSFHFFCVQSLGIGNVDPSVAMGYAIVAHLTFYVPITLWGLGILLLYGSGMGRLLALADSAKRSLDGPEVLAHSARSMRPPHELPPTPFLTSLVEALLPLDELRLKAAERDEVLSATARFVRAELTDLPGRLVWLFAIGMAGFRFLTAALHLRGFCSLPLAKRRSWVERLAYGSFSLGRQLFRAVRSTAFVGFYEHPIVQAQFKAPSLVSLKGGHAA